MAIDPDADSEIAKFRVPKTRRSNKNACSIVKHTEFCGTTRASFSHQSILVLRTRSLFMENTRLPTSSAPPRAKLGAHTLARIFINSSRHTSPATVVRAFSTRKCRRFAITETHHRPLRSLMQSPQTPIAFVQSPFAARDSTYARNTLSTPIFPEYASRKRSFANPLRHVEFSVCINHKIVFESNELCRSSSIEYTDVNGSRDLQIFGKSFLFLWAFDHVQGQTEDLFRNSLGLNYIK